MLIYVSHLLSSDNSDLFRSIQNIISSPANNTLSLANAFYNHTEILIIPLDFISVNPCSTFYSTPGTNYLVSVNKLTLSQLIQALDPHHACCIDRQRQC